MSNFIKYYFSIITTIIFLSFILIIIVLCVIQASKAFENSEDFGNSGSSIGIDASSETSNYYFNGDFFWPVPGFHKITSPFGPRRSPTAGSSSNHSGIDIAAPEGTVIYSAISGVVTFVGFKGAGGCTITTTSGNISVSYCHVSPNYIVSPGQVISAGEHIGNVGPKVLYGIPNNPYKDSNRQSNQWCYHWLSSPLNNP